MTTAPPPTDPPAGYPVVLTLSGRRCLVVGGGPVAARRARGLLEAGAMVTVVAPDVVPALERLADGGPLEVVRRPYRSGEAARYHLVLTATGVPEVDRSVVADAESAGVLVNTAGGDAPGTVQLPAVHREGPVTVAVSTGGHQPGPGPVAGRPSGRLPPRRRGHHRRAARRGPRRPCWLPDASTGSVDWQAVLTESVVPLVEAGRIDEARAVLRARVTRPPTTGPVLSSVPVVWAHAARSLCSSSTRSISPTWPSGSGRGRSAKGPSSCCASSAPWPSSRNPTSPRPRPWPLPPGRATGP